MSNDPTAATPEPRPTGWTGYLAADGYEADLRAELGEIALEHGRLLFASGPPRPAAWAQNVWFDPVRIGIGSIGDGAKALRAIQRNWVHYGTGSTGRARLIEAKLPSIRIRPHDYPAPAPTAPLGSWTLIDPNTIIAASHCSSPFAHGEVTFVEDKSTPPNRAYLKLWEFFTLLGVRPQPGETCLDLGASPGGWTWVIHETGASVIAVDKAPLAPQIAALPRVQARRESAFALAPDSCGRIDWLFSDVICYPTRLLAMVQRWLDAGTATRMVCSVKFQGPTDHAIVREFAAIPGSRLIHLHHNKHELTWFKL